MNYAERRQYEWLYRDMPLDNNRYANYYVTIEQVGPRGGKRPPLIKAYCRGEDYTEAVEYVEQHFLSRTKTTVMAGA